MDLNYTPDDVAFRKQVRAWLEHNLPAAPLRSLAERKIWHRKIYEAGYLGMGWPKEYGGGGARPMEQAIVADEMAQVNAPAPTWAPAGDDITNHHSTHSHTRTVARRPTIRPPES